MHCESAHSTRMCQFIARVSEHPCACTHCILRGPLSPASSGGAPSPGSSAPSATRVGVLLDLEPLLGRQKAWEQSLLPAAQVWPGWGGEGSTDATRFAEGVSLSAPGACAHVHLAFFCLSLSMGNLCPRVHLAWQGE